MTWSRYECESNKTDREPLGSNNIFCIAVCDCSLKKTAVGAPAEHCPPLAFSGSSCSVPLQFMTSCNLHTKVIKFCLDVKQDKMIVRQVFGFLKSKVCNDSELNVQHGCDYARFENSLDTVQWKSSFISLV